MMRSYCKIRIVAGSTPFGTAAVVSAISGPGDSVKKQMNTEHPYPQNSPPNLNELAHGGFEGILEHQVFDY
jgi:hypothetical protein